MILDKPAGLPCHAGPRGGASAEDWFGALSRRRSGPWLAHRIDADTAGCLAVALRKQALLEMQALFAGGGADKTYWAVVRGRPERDQGRIENRIAKRSGRSTGWRMAIDPAGETAVTEWRLLGSDGARSWLELRPRTGRTHQLRLHCSGVLGCPIVGEAVYDEQGYGEQGYSEAGPPARLHLLARALTLALDPPAAAVAPVPAHMRAALAGFGQGA